MTRLQDLSAALRDADQPDRKLDSEVTALALAPTRARLDDVAGLDGWDIVTPTSGSRIPSVWMSADDVLYATQFVDAAIELCGKAAPSVASAIVLRALAAVTRRNAPVTSAEDLAGCIARHILAELVDEIAGFGAEKVSRVA